MLTNFFFKYLNSTANIHYSWYEFFNLIIYKDLCLYFKKLSMHCKNRFFVYLLFSICESSCRMVWNRSQPESNGEKKERKKEKTSNCNYDNEDLRKDVCLHFITFFFSFFKTKTLTWIEQNAVKKKNIYYKKRESDMRS
jgi:hypothetical protein